MISDFLDRGLLRGRLRGLLLGLAVGFGGLGHAAAASGTAAQGTVVVVAPGVMGGRAADRAVAQAVEAAGAAHGRLVPADEWLAGIDVHGLPASAADVGCDPVVAVEAWRARLSEAERTLQRLSFGPALSQLVTLDGELTCLRTPPTTADLQRVALDLGTAYHYSARDLSTAPADRQSYARERDAALHRAAVWGAGLAVPTNLPSELRTAFLRERDLVANGPTVRVVVREGLRWDGRVVGKDPMIVPVGTHLVHAPGHGGGLVGARVDLPPERDALVWAPRGGDAVPDPAVALARLGSASDPEDGPLLAGLLALHGGTASDVLFVSSSRGGVQVWTVEGGVMRPVHPLAKAAREGPEAGARWAVGVGGAVGVSSLGGGSLDGLGGVAIGPALAVDIRVLPMVAVDVSGRILGVSSNRPWEEGGGVLFRATIPLLAGLVWTPRGVARGGRIGGGVGVDVLGAYPDAASVTPLIAARAGWAGGPARGAGQEVAAGWWTAVTAGVGWVGRDGGGALYPRVTVEGGLAWGR